MQKISTTILFSAILLPSALANFKKGTEVADVGNQSDYYIKEQIPLPKDTFMEISSLALMPGKKLAVANRRGEIWIVSGAYEEDLSKVQWKLVFNGAHEPLGMFEQDQWLHFTDRDAYAKIADTDNNGSYESYEIISNKWGINGNYHEYNFGSTPDKNGNVYIAHCLTGSSKAKSQWRGWAQIVSPDGTTTPFASGVRSPGGIGYNKEGDVFYTDNQGFWNGTSCLKHLKKGSFTGNPTGNIYYKDAPHMGKQPKDPINGSTIAAELKRIPQFTPPAVQIPHGKVGQSPTGIITDLTDGKFGPFVEQLLLGEQTHSQVQRLYLEKVNGVYQGAIWHFLGGFKSGIIPIRLSDEGILFTGGSHRGWSSAGGEDFSLERVRWTGKKPFEMLKVEALHHGFKITFTEALQAKEVLAQNVSVKAWTYTYGSKYGSPEIDLVTPKVISSTLSKDKKTLTVSLNKMTQGHVHHIRLDGLKSASGQNLWHQDVYYTLNQIPDKVVDLEK